ncbi:MAG: YajG family lipoprotein [Planctomycetales bacterium]|nr:YajG family lipoprotein [Planctomycetales bacterium]
MKSKTLLTIGACFLAGTVLTGCRKPLQKQTFLLEVRRPETAAVQSIAACLDIRPCQAASGFSGSQLIYRTSQVAYDQDYYHAFLVSPEDQITEHLTQWCHSSGLFACPPNAETVTLEPYLEALYADFQQKNSHAAVARFHVRLTRVDKSCSCPVVLLNKTYSAATPLSPGPDGAEVVNGLSAALTQILQELEHDLAFSSPSPGSKSE